MNHAVVHRRKGYQHEINIREHRLIVDEPESSGGTDQGPTPPELLAAALASCTAITIEMYADRKEWDLGNVEVSTDLEEATVDTAAKFKVRIELPAELTEEQRDRILKIAQKCPVHRVLTGSDVEIEDTLEPIEG